MICATSKKMLAAVVGLIVCLPSGCDRKDPGADRDASTTARRAVGPESAVASLSPTEVVHRAHRCRVSGRLPSLEEFLVPEQRLPVVDLIRAVDRLINANEVLQAAVSEHIGPGSATAFDRRGVANMIGMFSMEVRTVDERVKGDTAVVTIQVADRVPLDEVQLVRRDDRWLIQTDPPIEGLADELRNLAEVLVETAHRLERESMTADQLSRELQSRQAPIWRRLTALIEQRPP